MKIGTDIQNMISTKMPTKPGFAVDSLKGKSNEELKKASKEFESMFMNLVIKEMRNTVPDSEVWGDSSKIKFFESMLDEEYSKMMQDSPNSLANQIYQNLSRILGQDSQGDQK